MKFSAWNVNFSNPILDPLDLSTLASTRGTPVKSGYLYSVGLVADRHSHAAYHNKHWWKASYECQHR